MDEFTSDPFFTGMRFFWPRDRPGLSLPVFNQERRDCSHAFVLCDVVYPELIPMYRDQVNRGFKFDALEDGCTVSVQELMDHLVPPGSGVLSYTKAFTYMKNGVCSEDQYPYIGTLQAYQEHTKNFDSKIVVKDWEKIPENDVDLVVYWLNMQPLTGSIPSVPSFFDWKSKGIYRGATQEELETLAEEKRKALSTDGFLQWSERRHAVTLVGYGVGETAYYVCKNSLGTNWGHKGYMKVVRENVVEDIYRPVEPFKDKKTKKKKSR